MWVSMPDLIDILGRDMAVTLARNRGGVSTYVPHQATPDNVLARLVGMRGMAALCQEFGGEFITVPNGKREPYKEAIHRMLSLGKNKRDIALECGVTERYVYYVANLRPRQQQLTLL